MNAAINQDVLVKTAATNSLDLPGDYVQVFHHPTYLKVINELHAPKGHVNKFADGFKYRTAEDIQEALKPILLKHKCTVITRKFDKENGFEIYAYMVFKDHTYILCELPGVAEFDFDRDLGRNTKVNKTQQYAAYQSYAKKYALGNLLQIDDSQHDLDAVSNENIKNERNQNNRAATQEDCDRALQQIDNISLDTSLENAVNEFNKIICAYPNTLYETLNNACCKKYAEIEQHLYVMQNAQQDAVAFNNTGNTNALPKNTTGTKSQPAVQQQAKANNTPKVTFITAQQRDELQAFIEERGLSTKDVCQYLAIDTLMQIDASKLDLAKNDIEQMAHEEMKS